MGAGVNFAEGVVLVESLLLAFVGTGLFLLIFFCWLALCLELQPVAKATITHKAIAKVLGDNFIFYVDINAVTPERWFGLPGGTFQFQPEIYGGWQIVPTLF